MRRGEWGIDMLSREMVRCEEVINVVTLGLEK